MGSASSHGIHLSPARTTTYSTNKHYQRRRINRYAHPHNRVLPPPVAGQRLRSTDNGSILQEKGTIRGQRTGGSPLPDERETEFLRVLQRRSERSLDGAISSPISSKCQSYSDPNITYSLQINDSNKKSKSSKKVRAPAPPSLKKKRNGSRKTKNPAPPPPPFEHSVNSRAHTSPKLIASGQEGISILFPNESRHTVLEKRNHVRNDSFRKCVAEKTTTNINEAFTEEIREATKRIADKMGKVARRRSSAKDGKSPKQYYFPDVEIKKARDKQGAVKVDEANCNNGKGTNSATPKCGPNTKRDQVETSVKQNLHNRIVYQQPQMRKWGSERNSVSSSSCYSDSLPSLSGSEEDDINLKLRPTLPRRQVELPKFSPTEAWKFLGIHNLGLPKESVPSSDGEEEERMWRINKLTSPKTAILERCEDSGISPDAESPVMSKDKFDISKKQQPTIVIGQHSWIPEQDLLEDSDSNEFDDCIRNQRYIRVPVKLTLPNEMFSSKLNFTNKTVNHDDPEEKENRIKGRRNITKHTKHDGLSNIKRTLGMHTKSSYTNKLDSNWLLNQKCGRNYKLIGNYNYVNSGGRKQLQSFIFGVKKEKQKEEKNERDDIGLRRKFSFYSTEGHVVYLPEYETVDLMRKQTKRREVERKYSSKRKKALDRRTAEMNEINKLDTDEWLLQMQKQHKRERDREKINIRDKLKMYQVERHPTPRILDDDDIQIHNSQSLEDLSDRQEGTNSPLLRNGWKSTPAELNNLHQVKIESSTSSPSSPESIKYNQPRKPYVGASKWMRRQRQPPQERNFSPTRPEPEGGGASSEENLNQATDDSPTDNSQSPITRKPSIYTQLMEMAKEEEQKLKSEEQLNAAKLKNTNQAENEQTEPKQRMEKEGAESSWKFKPAYPKTEIQTDKNVPNKPKEIATPCGKTFYMELEERMKQITQQSQNKEAEEGDGAKVSRRTNGLVKTILPNVVVNEGGYKSVIQLSSVQPFTPNKSYRPVPFNVPAVQKDDEHKSGEITIPKVLPRHELVQNAGPIFT